MKGSSLSPICDDERPPRRAHHRPLDGEQKCEQADSTSPTGAVKMDSPSRLLRPTSAEDAAEECLSQGEGMEGDEVRKARLPGKQATSSAPSLTHRLPVSAVISNSAHDHHLRHIVLQLVSQSGPSQDSPSNLSHPLFPSLGFTHIRLLILGASCLLCPLLHQHLHCLGWNHRHRHYDYQEEEHRLPCKTTITMNSSIYDSRRCF